jgi:hypothetical protein
VEEPKAPAYATPAATAEPFAAPDSPPMAAMGVTAADPAPAPAEPAPKARKKDKPEREFKQLGLFE